MDDIHSLSFALEHGADLTATNNEGHTALSLAVGVGNKNGETCSAACM